MLIPIAEIAVINRQRKTLDPERVAALASSIEANGLLHPIVIREPFDYEGDATEGRPYVLCVGGRRLAAYILLGRTEIEANLKSELNPIRAEICELDENIKREAISWQEENDARARIAELLRQERPSITHAQIADEIGISGGQLTKELQLNAISKKDPTVRSAASRGAAIRTAVFKAEIDRRIATVELLQGGKIADLKSRLFTGDSRTFIRAIPTQSIDLVFSDLPYGIDYIEQLASSSANKLISSFDDSPETAKDFIADIVPQCLRVVKPSGWVVFFMCYEWHGWLQELIHDTCSIHFDYRMPDATECFAAARSDVPGPCQFFRPELPPWIWTRRGSGNHGHWPELHASNRYEMLVVVNGGAAKLARKPVENVLDFPPLTGERLHANQKPIPLCKEIIERTTVLGERVLDICYGSGAHLAAAAALGRDFIGCDSNPSNLNSALSLVAQHYSPAVARAVRPTVTAEDEEENLLRKVGE